MERIERLLTMRFDALDSRVDDLTVQVRETNGRLRAAEGAIADAKPRMVTLEREMGELRKGENRRISIWDVWIVLGSIASTVGVMKFFGALR